jgi:hypothetical protein
MRVHAFAEQAELIQQKYSGIQLVPELMTDFFDWLIQLGS